MSEKKNCVNLIAVNKVVLISMTLTTITFFSACEWAEFNKSCNLIGSWTGQNFHIQTATAGGSIYQVDLFS